MHASLRTIVVRTAALGTIATSAVLVPSTAHAAEPGTTTRVSVGVDGAQADSNSTNPSISNDGRYVAFGSNATNLVPGDTNGLHDIFVHDSATRTTELVTVGLNGEPANGMSLDQHLSGNGRFVAFYSDATNLVAGDTNGETDVFVYDRNTKRTVMAPGGADGGLFPVISDSGRYVVYATEAALVPEDGNLQIDLYLFDRVTGTASLVSKTPSGRSPSGGSSLATISGNGRYIAYRSNATGIVPDRPEGSSWVYLYDRVADTTTLIASSSGESTINPGPISANGRFITLTSNSDSVVAGDSNGEFDVFLYDRNTGRTTAVSTTPAGTTGDGMSLSPDISPDGRYVSFFSTAHNIVDGIADPDMHVYLYDRRTGRNTVVSVPPGGKGNGGGFGSSLSIGGRFVAYESFGTDLVAGDTNDEMDVFVTQLY